MDAALELGRIFIQSDLRGSAAQAKKYLIMAKSAEQISDTAREEADALIARLEGRAQ